MAIQAEQLQLDPGQLRKQVVNLFSQQIWCWGQDVLRAEGNWLLELGFERIKPPANRESCSSVYKLELPRARRVVLRGFGVFFGDDELGGTFVPRFESAPKYTTESTLECPPWSSDDLPQLSTPTDEQRDACRSLTLDLIDWVHNYELTIVERLGIEYRESTLQSWDSNKRVVIPAEEMASAWQQLGLAVSENFPLLLPQRKTRRKARRRKARF